MNRTTQRSPRELRSWVFMRYQDEGHLHFLTFSRALSSPIYFDTALY